MNLLMSIVGMLVLIAIAVLISDNRKAIKLRTVGGAFAIQFLFGGFILFVPWGQKLLHGVSDAVQNVINYGKDGIGFLFGSLVNFSVEGIGFIFALQVLPTVVFFSSLISVLYYLGVMQLVVRVLGGALRKVLGTSHAESMSATANIFIGQTEAPLVVRPYIPKMTQSELFAVMCGGLASVAGGVLAGYASMGVPLHYLIAASFMAAPGGLFFAKLIKPETEEPIEQFADDTDDTDKPANVIDAAASGAAAGMHLALNIGAMLLAFIGLIALINGILGGIGGWFGMESLTLELILSYIFAPIAFLIGVPWEDASTAGSLIGQKLVLNEFVAYLNFTPLIPDLNEKTVAIISFALCGFANLSSVAVLLGGLGSIAPARRNEIARFGIKAIAAGTLSNLMSATIAGFFLSLAIILA